MLIVAFSTATSRTAIGLPSGPKRRMMSGEIGSLKVRESADGASLTTAPSQGTALTRAACPDAPVVNATNAKNAQSQRGHPRGRPRAAERARTGALQLG